MIPRFLARFEDENEDEKEKEAIERA